MASTTLYTIVVLTLVISTIDAAKILVIPAYHYSHVNFMGVAGSALRDAGHDVTFMVSSTFESSPTKYKLKSLVYKLAKEDVFRDAAGGVVTEDIPMYQKIYKGITEVYPIIGRVCDVVLGNKELMSTIEKAKFDLVLHDGVPFMHCLYTIGYKFDIPYMTINVIQDPWSLGIPASAAIEPVLIGQMNNYMSFFERLQTAITYILVSQMPPLTTSSDHHVGKYTPEKPLVSAHYLYAKSEMFLINHQIMCVDYPRISMPHYQYVGGSSAKPPSPLSQDLETFVNGAKDGIVVMTFGSLPALQHIWKAVKPKLIYVFQKLPQFRLVALYNLDNKTDDFPANVMTMKWLPQNDLLGHTKTRLFVTHGGNNGQLEATYHGVPSLVLPMAGDQVYNGMRAITHNYGKMVENWDTITKEELLQTFQELLNNDAYSNSVKKCSKIIKSLPSTQQNVVFWVNHILEFGGSHLQPPSVDMPLYKMFMIDILVFTVFVVTVISVISFLCCRWCLKKCCKSNSMKHKKE